jgi:hypothetical protein
MFIATLFVSKETTYCFNGTKRQAISPVITTLPAADTSHVYDITSRP